MTTTSGSQAVEDRRAQRIAPVPVRKDGMWIVSSQTTAFLTPIAPKSRKGKGRGKKQRKQ